MPMCLPRQARSNSLVKETNLVAVISKVVYYLGRDIMP